MAVVEHSTDDELPAESRTDGLRDLGNIQGSGAECAICFAPLPSEEVCVLIKQVGCSSRACRHYFHFGCAQLLLRSAPAPWHCPLCRRQFARVERLPDVRLDGAAWFRVISAGGTASSALEKAEVVDALCATLPVDGERLSRSLDGGLWERWDTHATGRITLDAFKDPARGLLPFVLYSLPSLRGSEVGRASGPVPDMFDSREAWFRCWDERGAHALEFLPCLRAVVRTLHLDGVPEDARIVREVLTAVWCEFGLLHNESGTDELLEFRPLSLMLFCERPDGLCDLLFDSLCKTFGAATFWRIRRRAQLLQESTRSLRLQLASCGTRLEHIIEKRELVDAILDAKEAMSNSSNQVGAKDVNSIASNQGALLSTASAVAGTRQPDIISLRRASVVQLPLSELQAELRLRGVAYAHCVERAELEELLSRVRRQEVAARQDGSNANAKSAGETENIAASADDVWGSSAWGGASEAFATLLGDAAERAWATLPSPAGGFFGGFAANAAADAGSHSDAKMEGRAPVRSDGYHFDADVQGADFVRAPSLARERVRGGRDGPTSISAAAAAFASTRNDASRKSASPLQTSWRRARLPRAQDHVGAGSGSKPEQQRAQPSRVDRNAAKSRGKSEQQKAQSSRAEGQSAQSSGPTHAEGMWRRRVVRK